jgi:hypothetical protein
MLIDCSSPYAAKNTEHSVFGTETPLRHPIITEVRFSKNGADSRDEHVFAQTSELNVEEGPRSREREVHQHKFVKDSQ